MLKKLIAISALCISSITFSMDDDQTVQLDRENVRPSITDIASQK
ncbi:hypothetical protein AB4525_07125 [Vibrio breoganii]|nr:hypothetical protein [Vibrio breoganii]MDN3717974.1 hypothetical protein [Vibrio breoganii]